MRGTQWSIAVVYLHIQPLQIDINMQFGWIFTVFSTKHVVLPWNFPPDFHPPITFQFLTWPANDEMLTICQILYVFQPATQQHNILLGFKFPILSWSSEEKLAAVWIWSVELWRREIKTYQNLHTQTLTTHSHSLIIAFSWDSSSIRKL